MERKDIAKSIAIAGLSLTALSAISSQDSHCEGPTRFRGKEDVAVCQGKEGLIVQGRNTPAWNLDLDHTWQVWRRSENEIAYIVEDGDYYRIHHFDLNTGKDEIAIAYPRDYYGFGI